MIIRRSAISAALLLLLGLPDPAEGGDAAIERDLRACRLLLAEKKDEPPVAAAIRVEMASFLQALGRERESFDMLDEAIATEGLTADERRVIRERALDRLKGDFEWRLRHPLAAPRLPLLTRLLDPGEPGEVEGADLRDILTRAIGTKGIGVWVNDPTAGRDLRRLALPEEATLRRSLAKAVAKLDPSLECLLLDTSILVGPREAIARARAVRDMVPEARDDDYVRLAHRLSALGTPLRDRTGRGDLAGLADEIPSHLPLFVLPEYESALRSVKIPPDAPELPVWDAAVVLAFLAPRPLELAWWRRSLYLGDPEFHRVVRERATVSSSTPVPAGPFDCPRVTVHTRVFFGKSLSSLLLNLGLTWTGPPENLDILVEIGDFSEGPTEAKLEASAPVWNLRYRLSESGAEFEVLSPERQAKLLKDARRTSGLSSAIVSHLAWLARHQAPDGRWGADSFTNGCRPVGSCEYPRPEDVPEGYGLVVSDVGVTALAVLAFIRAGHTHQFGEQRSFVEAVRKGKEFLKRVQIIRPEADEHGRFRGRADPRSIHDHALASLALADLRLLTGDRVDLAAPVSEAARFSLRARSPGAGWGYGPRPAPSDSFTTAWMVLALKATKTALGEDDPIVPEIDRAIEEAVGWLRSVTDPETGITGYRADGPAGDSAAGRVPMLTAANLFARRNGGEKREDPLVRKAVDLLAKRPPAWRGSEDPGSGTFDFSYAYLGMHALCLEGGEAWKSWSSAVKKALIPHERKVGCAAGSWDPVDPWIASGGRVAATALAAMTLEVYARYRRAQEGPRPAGEKSF